MRTLPSVEYLRQCLRYEDGKLFWLERPRGHFPSDKAWKRWNGMYVGQEAGNKSDHRDGFRWTITMLHFPKLWRHRVVWALHHGDWPGELDHKDRDRLNDRIENLRPATRSQNGGNCTISKLNTSGIKGVHWYKPTQKWVARIGVNRQRIHLGYFNDRDQATLAYDQAAQQHFGAFASGGRA